MLFQVTFTEHGKATLKNYAGSHWQQRSNMSPSLETFYSEKSKKSSGSSRSSEGGASPVPRPPPLHTVVSPYRIESKKALLSKHLASKK